ncbi:MAG: fused MFS/spermidine synthase [Myxococcota bacterium]
MIFAYLLVCFFLSGFSALLYETAWSREFAFVFGTSELAVVAVLAAYMGGLALGAAVASRWAHRVRRPVLAYGVIELGIALWALAVPWLIRGLRTLYLGWLGGLDVLPETLGLSTHAFHLFGAFLVLVPCTALMGATLPLLARHAVTKNEQVGPRIGLLYAINTFGAIAGTLTAAFVLLPAVGLRNTVYIGAIINGLVFLAAAGLARQAPNEGGPVAVRSTGLPWILPLILVSGAVSFGYEVLWFRLLGHVVGGSTAAFSTMLASFLAGIALGSAVASRWARTHAAARNGFVVAQLATATLAWLGFHGAAWLPELARGLGASLNNLGAGAVVSMGALLPLTLCVGATFPFAVRLLAKDAEDASASSARVYAWNTVGSIIGAVGTGYWLLPWLGLEGTLVAGAATNLALAAIAALWETPRRVPLANLAGAAFLVLLLAAPPRPEALIRSSPMGGGVADGDFHYFAVGRSATVALVDQGVSWRLSTNGLPESIITPPGYPNGALAARWLSLLPTLARPDIEDMLIIGLGGGVTVGAVPQQVRSVDVIELEPEVAAANRSVPERSDGHPLEDPRVSLRLTDARGALILADKTFDAIVSQPSHPWTSGASHLYTKDFFELVRARLSDDGMFVQWIGGSFVDPNQLRSLVASLVAVFGHVEVYMPAGGAVVLMASPAPFDITEVAPQVIAANPDDYSREGLDRIEDLLPARVLDIEGSRAAAEGAQLTTDDWNLLATASTLVYGGGRQRLRPLLQPLDPLPAIATDYDLVALTRRLFGQTPVRLKRLAATLPPGPAALVRGWFALEAGRPAEAMREFEAATQFDATLAEARDALAFVRRDPTVEGLSPQLRDLISAKRQERESWEAVRDLDTSLALWKPGDVWYPEAAELRVRWRIEIGDADDHAEALRLLDRRLQRRYESRSLLMRARLGYELGRQRLGWYSLDALADKLGGRPNARLATPALRLARLLGPPPDPGIVEALRAANRPR